MAALGFLRRSSRKPESFIAFATTVRAAPILTGLLRPLSIANAFAFRKWSRVRNREEQAETKGMKQSRVWFSPGSRMDVAFATADLKIRALKAFIGDVAASIAAGDSLSKAARTAALRHPAAADTFDLGSADLDTQFALSDALTFPNEPLPEFLSFEQRTKRMSLRLDGVLARDVKSLLELCGAGRSTADEIRQALDYPAGALFESLLENEIVAASDPPENLDLALRRPGVTRLQHAGLFYRGRETGVLVDPHLHSSYEPHDLSGNFLRSQFEGHVNAILISHSHEDHWHLPTLMTFPSDMLI